MNKLMKMIEQCLKKQEFKDEHFDALSKLSEIVAKRNNKLDRAMYDVILAFKDYIRAKDMFNDGKDCSSARQVERIAVVIDCYKRVKEEFEDLCEEIRKE